MGAVVWEWRGSVRRCCPCAGSGQWRARDGHGRPEHAQDARLDSLFFLHAWPSLPFLQASPSVLCHACGARVRSGATAPGIALAAVLMVLLLRHGKGREEAAFGACVSRLGVVHGGAQ